MADDKPLFDLGVLFVHGIGDQERGSTLLGFGTPLVEWLEDRAAASGCQARVAEAEIKADVGNPSYATLALDGEGVSQQWIMAESWWAESFIAPPFADLARWGFAVAPWTLGSHFGERLRREWQRPPASPWQGILKPGRLTLAFLSLLGAMALSIAVVVGLVVLLWLSFIPWQRLRDALTAIQLRISASLGDSYLFAARPIEFAAILTKVRRDLAWLSSRCRRVVVVAHSQGAAVACHVVAAEGGPNDHLITFGSGLLKLEQQCDLRSYPQLIHGAGLAIAGFLLSLIGFLTVPRAVQLLWAEHFHGLGDAALLLAYPAVGLALLIAGIGDFLTVHTPENIGRLRRAIAENGVTWRDFYASADPVPNGPLPEAPGSPPASIAVVNLGSVLRDHVAYWENRDVFVSEVGNAILNLAEVPIAFPRVEVIGIAKRRARRVRLLRATWLVTVAGISAFLIRYRDEWAAVIRWAFASALPAVAELIPVTIARIPSGTDWWRSTGLLALAIATYGAARAGWEGWNDSEMAVISARRYRRSADFVFAMTLGLHLLVLIAGTAGTLSTWMLLAGMVTAALAMFTSTSRKKREEELDERGPQPRTRRTLQVLVAGYMIVAAIAGAIVATISTVQAVSQRVASWETASPGWRLIAVIAVILGSVIIVGALLGGIIEFLRKRAQRKPQ